MLAVSGRKRSAVGPNVPTFAEQGLPTYEAYTWNNLFAPAKTPPEVIDRLNAALNKALSLQAVKNRLAQGASEALGPTTPDQPMFLAGRNGPSGLPFIRALRIDAN